MTVIMLSECGCCHSNLCVPVAVLRWLRDQMLMSYCLWSSLFADQPDCSVYHWFTVKCVLQSVVFSQPKMFTISDSEKLDHCNTWLLRPCTYTVPSAYAWYAAASLPESSSHQVMYLSGT